MKINEHIENLIKEISSATKASYTAKAKAEVGELKPLAKKGEYKDFAKKIIAKREKGIAMASEEASPMIKPPKNEFAKKEDAFAHAKKHGGKVMKKTFTHPTSGMKHVSYVVREELELDEAAFAPTMRKAIAAHERGDHKMAKYHLDNAKTARYALKSTDIAKHKDLLDKYKELRAMHEDVEGVAEAGPFSYGSKPPRKGTVAYNALMMRKKQEKNKPPIEPKDQMVGTAKIVKEDSVDEGIKSKLAAGALAATMALGAHARVSGDHKDDPNINRLTGKPHVTQTAEKPAETPEHREYEKPDKVERHEGLSHGDPITIHHGGKEYKGHIMPHNGPRMRGGKTLHVPHAMMGIRGLGHYEAQIHHSGHAVIYK